MVCILSLTVIYVGAGVHIVKYCCSHCEERGAEMVAYQGPNCARCLKGIHNLSSHHLGKDCCKATVYKVDFMDHSSDVQFSVPVIQLFSQEISVSVQQTWTTEVQICTNVESPHPKTSRYYLNLYSTLLI